MINILAVGNSFTNNTTRYLHVLGKAAGVEVHTVNLFIGGCPLKRHWENIETQKADYLYESDGIADEARGPVSVQSALQESDWDYIVSQQASHDSGLLETYQPYATQVYHYLHQAAPDAELWMQQTWAYDNSSKHEAFPRYQSSETVMYAALTHAYLTTAKALNVPLIPSGQLVQRLRQEPEFDVASGGVPLNADDGYHLSDYGKYATALLWLRIFADVDPTDVPLVSVPDFDIEQFDQPLLKKVQKITADLPLTVKPVEA